VREGGRGREREDIRLSLVRVVLVWTRWCRAGDRRPCSVWVGGSREGGGGRETDLCGFGVEALEWIEILKLDGPEAKPGRLRMSEERKKRRGLLQETCVELVDVGLETGDVYGPAVGGAEGGELVGGEDGFFEGVVPDLPALCLVLLCEETGVWVGDMHAAEIHMGAVNGGWAI